MAAGALMYCLLRQRWMAPYNILDYSDIYHLVSLVLFQLSLSFHEVPLQSHLSRHTYIVPKKAEVALHL